METNKGKGNFHYNLSTIYKIKYFYNEFQKTANKNSGVVNCRQTSEMLKKYNSSGMTSSNA